MQASSMQYSYGGFSEAVVGMRGPGRGVTKDRPKQIEMSFRRMKLYANSHQDGGGNV